MPMQAWGQWGPPGETDMSKTAEREDVVWTATSREGICHQVIRRPNGTYMMETGGELVESLYWRAGELDRCVRALQQLMGGESDSISAAA